MIGRLQIFQYKLNEMIINLFIFSLKLINKHFPVTDYYLYNMEKSHV